MAVSTALDVLGTCPPWHLTVPFVIEFATTNSAPSRLLPLLHLCELLLSVSHGESLESLTTLLEVYEALEWRDNAAATGAAVADLRWCDLVQSFQVLYGASIIFIVMFRLCLISFLKNTTVCKLRMF